MVVAVDIGNSAIKLAFENDSSNVIRIEPSADLTEFHRSLESVIPPSTESAVGRWYLCSVNQPVAMQLCDWVQQQRPNDHISVIKSHDIPLKSAVADRDALGRDRLLASWFAAKGGSRNAIVVDAGTAVTIDVVADNMHQGGLIFPGANSTLTALDAATDALPDLSHRLMPSIDPGVQIGQCTESAILLGVQQLQWYGLLSIVDQLHQSFPASKIIGTGGWLASAIDHLPPSWDFQPNLLTDAIFSLSGLMSGKQT